ncbi:MAG: site-specific DNA-methyltransferase [Lactobacillus sp.]|nr:site-specific DNA-methyltransferase [Lactobacillus sp.]
MNYKINQGDCLELMKELPNGSIDMILADLPYGILSSEKWDQCLPLDKLWIQYKRLIKNHGCIALFGQEPFSSRLRLSNVDWYRYDWIWQKSQAGGVMLSHDRPLRSYETISIFSPSKTAFHPPLESQDRFDEEQKFPKDIIYFSNRRKKSYHPTQKPKIPSWVEKL